MKIDCGCLQCRPGRRLGLNLVWAGFLLLAGVQPGLAKPNFIFILCDDLGYNDLGCYTYPSKANPGPPPPPAPTTYVNVPAPNSAYDATRTNQTLTPNIDQLASEGMRFKNFHTSPVCSASRSSLMTGCYAPRVGINGVLAYNDAKGLNSTEVTLPELLKQAGYETAMVGKWHLGYQTEFFPTRQGFDEFFGLPYSHNMPNLNLYEGETPIENIGGDATKLSLLTQRYTARALDVITRNQTNAFFLYLAQNMPHIPTYASTNFAGASGKGSYYDAVMELDWSVGQIMAKLRELHLDTNTLVIFTSDNGPWQNAPNVNFAANAVGSAYPLRDCKTTSWEGGVRTPFIAHWPRQIPTNTETGVICGLIDILPTLTKLAGSGPPSDRVIDGGDLWPVLAGQPGAVSPHSEYYIFDGAGLDAVTVGPWKLRQTGTSTNLSNLDADIQEQTNAAAANPATYTQLRNLQTTYLNAFNAAKRTVGTYSAQEILIVTNQLSIPAGSNAFLQFKLAQKPATNLTVNVKWFSGATNFTVTGATNFVFTTNNWDTLQTATITAGMNVNALIPGAEFRLSSAAFQPVRKVFSKIGIANTAIAPDVTILSPAAAIANLTDTNSQLLAEGLATLNGATNVPGLTYSWRVTPTNGVTLTTPTARSTGIAFSTNGSYAVRLAAEASGASDFAQFTVNVGATYSLPPTDLVAWFPFDETSGTTATDATEGGHDGTLLNSPAWQPAGGRFGGALLFHGTPDIVTLADSADINLTTVSTRTIGLWFKAAGSGTPAGRQFLFDEGGATRGLNIYLDAGKLVIGGWETGSGTLWSTYLTNAATLTAGQWCHVALVLEANTALTANDLRGYLNGTLFGSGDAASLISQTDNTGIGGIAERSRPADGPTTSVGASTGGTCFDGWLDEVAIYNRALSAAEIGALAGIVAGNVGPQVSAGTNQTVTLAAGATLTGSVADDGLPAGIPLTKTWSPVAGPGTSTLANATNAVTTASFSLPGVYQLRLAADDGEVRTYADVLVTVIQPAQPVLSLAGFNNGQFGFTINGDAGWDYIIQTSTNLTDWSPYWTNLSPVTPFQFTDPATNLNQRFYRVLLAP